MISYEEAAFLNQPRRPYGLRCCFSLDVNIFNSHSASATSDPELEKTHVSSLKIILIPNGLLFTHFG